jgi:hypothetical protein
VKGRCRGIVRSVRNSYFQIDRLSDSSYVNCMEFLIFSTKVLTLIHLTADVLTFLGTLLLARAAWKLSHDLKVQRGLRRVLPLGNTTVQLMYSGRAVRSESDLEDTFAAMVVRDARCGLALVSGGFLCFVTVRLSELLH